MDLIRQTSDLILQTHVQFSSIQFNPVQFNSTQFQFRFNSVQINSAQFGSTQFSSVHFSSIQFRSVQFNSGQFSSIQFNSIQFSSIRFNAGRFGSTNTKWRIRRHFASQVLEEGCDKFRRGVCVDGLHFHLRGVIRVATALHPEELPLRRLLFGVLVWSFSFFLIFVKKIGNLFSFVCFKNFRQKNRKHIVHTFFMFKTNRQNSVHTVFIFKTNRQNQFPNK